MIFHGCIGGGAFIERHDDVRPQSILHLHAALRIQMHHASVDVALKRHAVVGDLVEISHGKNLEPPGVGEDRPGPRHEAMQIAEFRHDLLTGPQHQVISVGENALCAGFGDLPRRQSLDRSLRADGHERRGLEAAMKRGDPTATSSSR
jgi:hypothetical protein